MSSLLVTIPFIVSLYLLGKLLLWFLSPFIVDYKDRNIPTIRDYNFTDPSITTKYKSTIKFPTINDKPTKTMSLILPAYNEEKRIRACLDPTLKYLLQREENSKNKNKNQFSWEIIVVNDGSKDKTCDVVQQYVKKYTSDKIRLLTYPINQGKGFAVQQGMLHAQGCFIIFADADGASEITHFSRLEESLLEKLNKTNVWDCSNLDGIAIGSRAHLQKQAEAERTVLRNILMWGFHFVVEWIGNVHNIKDTQCGFKLFTRQAVKKTFLHQKIRRWCFDPELLMLAQQQNIPICEVQIKWQEIPDGQLQPLFATFNMLREIILFRCCWIFGFWYKNVTK